MALKRRAYTRPSRQFGLPTRGVEFRLMPRRVGGSRRCAQKGLGLSLPGAAAGADLGGSSKYSSEALED